jgi:hypothetical protein
MSSLALSVVQPPVERVQDCSTCRNQKNCWMKGIGPRTIAINLLVCRMLRGIDRDNSTRLLLELLRPKVGRIASDIAKRVAPVFQLDADEVICDIESAVVEYLLSRYLMGELAYPLYYLFGGRNGVMFRWSLAYISKIRRNWKDTYSVGICLPEGDRMGSRASSAASYESRLRIVNSASAGMQMSSMPSSPLGEAESVEDSIVERLDSVHNARKALSILDDGHTLPLTEYRVLAFCFENAHDRGVKRPTNGLHAYMAKRFSVVRSRIGRLYSLGVTQLTETMERL